MTATAAAGTPEGRDGLDHGGVGAGGWRSWPECPNLGPSCDAVRSRDRHLRFAMDKLNGRVYEAGLVKTSR